MSDELLIPIFGEVSNEPFSEFSDDCFFADKGSDVTGVL